MAENIAGVRTDLVDMIRQGGAKAISVASSYGDGDPHSNRRDLTDAVEKVLAIS
jgi:hypothetical protein